MGMYDRVSAGVPLLGAMLLYVLLLAVTPTLSDAVAAEGVQVGTLNSTELFGFHWVLAAPGVSHVSACMANMLSPTTPLEDIPWSEEIMRDVVASLGLHVVNASHGLSGCCAPGLWCQEGHCYTQSLQDKFVNIGLSPKLNRSTVFTCVEYELENVVSGFLSIEDGAVSLTGSNYGLDRDALAVTLNSEQCTDVDLCHTVCQSCTSFSCPTGSVCLSMNSFRGCFMYCGGSEDTSCPCSTTCQQVNVAISQTSYVATHLCAPANLDCRYYSPYSGDSHLQCHTPSIYSQIYDGNSWPNSKQAVTLNVNHDALAFTSELSAPKCTRDSDCFDMDSYTSDTCSTEGICTYSKRMVAPLNSEQSEDVVTPAEGLSHGSTLSHIRDRTTPFTYAWFHLSDQESSQESFETELKQLGTESRAGNVDDYPVDYLNLDFTFNYFGNSLTEVTVNPNGVISFPPYSHCWGMITGLGCPVYRTSTNIISVWGRDWDPSMNGKLVESTIITYKQQRDVDESVNGSSLGGINSNAFHVMYSDIHIYDDDPDVRSDPANPNSFSVSIYEDGSVRLRYHKVTVDVGEVDNFGLWGSRAATPASPLLAHESSSTRYHQETFNGTQIVHDGQDVIFCSMATVACMSNTCTRAGEVASFSLLGAEPSCLAAADEMELWCVWGGGLASTKPSFSRSPGTNHTVVSCPTPTLSLEADSLVSLDLRYFVNNSMASSPMDAGQKSIFTKYFDSTTGEVSNSQLMVRYSSSTENEISCGCDAVAASSIENQCDKCMVCGNSSEVDVSEDISGMLDCHGDCMGTAYIDTCGTCAGGNSFLRPVSSCDYSENIGDDMSTISKTILFLTMMICITFMFSACLRIVRMSLSAEELEERARAGGAIPLQDPHRAAPLRRGNGLSSFEIDALGQDEFGLIKVSGDVESAATMYGARGNIANIECAICLNDFSDSSVCRQLPCDHVFHKSCIDEWFILSVKCPMCKRNIREIFLGEEALPQRRSVASVASPERPGPVSRTDSIGEDVNNPLMAVEMTQIQNI
jgi:hypothetical protein